MFKAASTLFLSVLVASVAFAVKPQAPNVPAAGEPPAPHAPEKGADVKGSIKMAKVFFVEPKDGATVPQTFHMKFGNEGGLKVVPAGEITPGTGHYHIIVDSAPLSEGTVVPTDAKNIHYGKGQTEADLKLPPGEHKLTLQFADGAHRSYGPVMSQTITVHVK